VEGALHASAPNARFMYRALIELFITILIVLVARAVLTSVMRGISNASANAFRKGDPQQSTAPRSANSPTSGELHKDPVCGTYVAESTPFRQQISGQVFFYCSDACREKHVLVAR